MQNKLDNMAQVILRVLALMEKLNKNKTGLVFGTLLGGVHLIWAILVATGVAKPLADFILSLHFLNISYEITSFVIGKAALLILITFVCGYIIGWVLAILWNQLHRK